MKKNKTLEKLKKHPKDLTYVEVNSMLIRLGYSLLRSKGTKVVYGKGGKTLSFHIPHRYETFQAYQVTRLLKDLGEDI